jgi:uncharacterized membrane protein YsdA (DUF1294 family)
VHWWQVIMAWYGLASAVTFIAYAWDKRRATIGGRRLSERALHVLALVGGWPGAHAGRALLSHKTRKNGFGAMLWSITLLHVVILILLWIRL